MAASASAAALTSVASAAAVGPGGSASLVRTLGRTQFLAMSVSMAVPFLPPQYVRLCQGFE